MQKEPPVQLDPNRHPYLKPEALPTQVYHVAVWGLFVITALCVSGIIALTFYDKTSEGLISIASACIGGLVGIFAQRATNHST